jgi:hypothetical protein
MGDGGKYSIPLIALTAESIEVLPPFCRQISQYRAISGDMAQYATKA